MDNWSFGVALFTPISFIPNLAIVYLIGLLGLRLVQSEPSRKEPVLLAHHLACVASAAFCSTALPIVFFVFFPLYFENIDAMVIAMRLFVANLALGLVLQVRGHVAIFAAGERYEEALLPARRPVLLSRFRVWLGAAAFFIAGGGAGAIVVNRVDSERLGNFRSAFQTCMGVRDKLDADLKWCSAERAGLEEQLQQGPQGSRGEAAGREGGTPAADRPR